MNPQIPDLPPAPQTLDQKYFRWFADTQFGRAVKAPGTQEGPQIHGPTSPQIPAYLDNVGQEWKQSSDPNGGYASQSSSQSAGNEPEDEWTEFFDHPKGDETYEARLGLKVILYEEEKQFLKTDLMRDFHFGRVLSNDCESALPQGHCGGVMKVLAHCRSTQFDDWPTRNGNPVYREFAMKVIRHEYKPSLVEEKLRKSPSEGLSEIQTLRYLRHENIVNIKEIIEIPGQTHNGFPYAAISIIMEYCDGDLKDLVEEEKPRRLPQIAPEHTTKHWFRHVMLGLEYLHRMGVNWWAGYMCTGEEYRLNILYLYRGRGVKLKDATLEQRILQSIFKISDFGLSEENLIKHREEMFEESRWRELGDVVEFVLEHIISGRSRFRKGGSSFKDYCETGELKGDYYEEWKQLSPEFQSFFLKYETRDFPKDVTAFDVLTDPWVDTDGQIREKLAEESGPVPGSTESAGNELDNDWDQSFDQLFSVSQQYPQDPGNESEDEWGDFQSFGQ